MLSSIWIASTLCSLAFAAPTITYATGAAEPAEMTVLAEYFQLLASKVQAGKAMAAAPVCDLGNAVLPTTSPTPLPAVSAGLVLKHVAIGRGTQNYSCSTTNATAAPVALGALATLYNASCIASTYPDVLKVLPNVALQFNMSSAFEQKQLSPGNLVVSGYHYFSNTTSPNFNLDTDNGDLGFAPCKKNNTAAAPVGSPKGQNDQGNGAVPWLKLTTLEGATGNLKEVYRVNTAGGSAPAVCKDMPATFEIQYAAEYWFYEADSSSSSKK